MSHPCNVKRVIDMASMVYILPTVVKQARSLFSVIIKKSLVACANVISILKIVERLSKRVWRLNAWGRGGPSLMPWVTRDGLAHVRGLVRYRYNLAAVVGAVAKADDASVVFLQTHTALLAVMVSSAQDLWGNPRGDHFHAPL
jgi:hypothetical protein